MPEQRVLAQLTSNLYKVAKLLIPAKYCILQGMALVALPKDSFKSVKKKIATMFT